MKKEEIRKKKECLQHLENRTDITETEKKLRVSELEHEIRDLLKRDDDDPDPVVIIPPDKKTTIMTTPTKSRKNYESDYRNMDHSIQKETQWILHAFSTLPKSSQQNLTAMTWNKGYIWKRVWFFGSQFSPPGCPSTLVFFEKKRGQEMLIHELHYRSHYDIYVKNHTKNSKQLLYHNPSLFDESSMM